jgi:Na+-exporting ATPase
MVMVLILSLIVSLAIKSWIEGGVIAGAQQYHTYESLHSKQPTAVVIVNVTVGFFQQYSAEKTMDVR